MMKAAGVNGNRVSILLIEDNPDDITLTLNVFKKNNLLNKVHVLKDGVEALDFLFSTGVYADKPQNGPELILLDLNLPKMHGLDVLKKIKSDERTKNLPVVILTASQEERGVMQSYKLGAQGCIVKPFEFQKFLEAVTELRLAWVLIAPSE
ncbi:MAG: response regulator [Verrucomicrobiota bacterium]|nr:response regulator [Verrucomicrobiota bacterium]